MMVSATGRPRSSVSCRSGGGEDVVRLAHVGLHVGRATLGRAGEQGTRVGQHDWVVVHVHDPRPGRHALHHLVQVGGGGNACADVQELVDLRLGRQPVGHPVHHRAVDVHASPQPGPGFERRGRRPIGLVVVLAAQDEVVHPRRMCPGEVDALGVVARHVRLPSDVFRVPWWVTNPGHPCPTPSSACAWTRRPREPRAGSRTRWSVGYGSSLIRAARAGVGRRALMAAVPLGPAARLGTACAC